MDTTTRFSLPLIMAAQASKHLTHNEALALLEFLVQPVVHSVGSNEPPANPEEAECIIVGDTPAGLFSGHANELAAYLAGAWRFFVPSDGWQVVQADGGGSLIFLDGTWQAASPQNTPFVGVNTTADSTNRLSVTAPATLLNAEVDDHRLVINKSGTPASSTLVFQSNWSGRAEFGLAGDDAFSVKVSANGTTWANALRADPATGRVEFPNRPAARASLTGGNRSVTAGTEVGWDMLAESQADAGLGVAASGGGHLLSVPATCLYHLAGTLLLSQGGTIELVTDDATVLTRFAANGSGQRSVSFCWQGQLTAGTGLALKFNDAATLIADAESCQITLFAL